MLDMKWHCIALNFHELPFKENQICEVTVEGRKICLGRHGEQYFAFAATCPHAGASFTEGFIDPLGNIVCPKHRYKFVLRNGYNYSGEGFKLKTYPLKMEDDGVYVGFDL